LNTQIVALFLDRAQGLGHSELQFVLAGLQASLKCGNFGVFAGGVLHQPGLRLSLSQLNGVFFLDMGGVQAFLELLLKLFVAHLLEDVGVAGFVDFEGFGAMGADDVVHKKPVIYVVEE
jgi:hypothetical protein